MTRDAAPKLAVRDGLPRESVTIRPATEADAERARDSFPDLLPDHWREGENRRSFVAVGPGGEVRGHCRGIDNVFHPDSRTLVFECAEEVRGTDAELALLRAQIEVSTVPLHVKVTRENAAMRSLLERVGCVVVQMMPPWRFTLTEERLAWARGVLERFEVQHLDLRIVPARECPVEELRWLEAHHYVEQHASWSPAASAEVLFEEFAEGYAEGEDSWDREISRAVIGSDGTVRACALAWPAEGGEPSEVTYESVPYGGAEAWESKLAAIAALMFAAHEQLPQAGDGAAGPAELAIDSHLSMREEMEAIGSIPGERGGEWMAIVAIPVQGGPAPIRLDPTLIPHGEDWVLALAQS